MQPLISDAMVIQDIVHQAKEQGVVALDTEFQRERTYHAILCVVQLGVGEDYYCLDGLELQNNPDIQSLLADESVIKILHAARQDVELLLETYAVIPKPIFDTQMAAAFLGEDMQIGYAALVKNIVGIELPKSQARTDWTRRPLSAQQLEYALADVEYLVPLMDALAESLNLKQKQVWFEQEIASLYNRDLYVVDPQKAYKRLNGGGLKLTDQYRLKALAQWRETIAQQSNIPRTWVAKDAALFDLAVQNPRDKQRLSQIKVLSPQSYRANTDSLLETLNSVEVQETRLWQRVESLTKPERADVSQMMKVIKQIANDAEVAQGLLATRGDLESFYRHKQSHKLQSGWRQAVIGDRLETFL